MTEVTKKEVNPKLVALLGTMKPVRAAANKLLTINERAAEQDAAAASTKEHMMKVLNGATDGEQDLSVLSKDVKKAEGKAEKIRSSAGVYARDLLKARAEFNAFVDELVVGIKVADDAEALDDEDTGTDGEEAETEELDV